MVEVSLEDSFEPGRKMEIVDESYIKVKMTMMRRTVDDCVSRADLNKVSCLEIKQSYEVFAQTTSQ